MAKRLRPGVFLAVMLMVILCASAALAADYGVIYRTETLNLRSQGSSSSQWLGSYPRGTWVKINGSQNNFYHVYTPDGRSGYMSKNYIQAVGDDDSTWMVKVTNPNGGSFLNLRAQPSYSAQVLEIFYTGVPLKVINSTNGWYQVQFNGQTGYVRSEYVADMGIYAKGSDVVATIKTPNNGMMNMRSGPSMNDPVIQQFPGDSYVSVIAKGKDWWYVSMNGIAGFMSDDYLVEGLHAARDLSANKSTISPSQAAYAVVSNPKSTQALNLRQFDSTASRVLDKLYNGRKLWINDFGSEWCAVTDQVTGLSGYVMTKYITLYNVGISTKLVSHPNGSYVNLRSSRDMSQNNVILRVPHGQWVTVLSPGSDWTKVEYNGYTGYIMTYFLQ
ncbi:MAG: SH3 domain-containing protein [Clostridia bacterium]|nr:SH3 domain-containing protein [Clostridia bacterium]